MAAPVEGQSVSRAGIVFLLAIGTTACGVPEAHSIGEASNILRSIGADVCMFGLADQTTMVDAVRGDSRFDTFERGHCAMRSGPPDTPSQVTSGSSSKPTSTGFRRPPVVSS